MDWAHPAGPATELRLAKLPAADSARRVGSLFFVGSSGVRSVFLAGSYLSPDLLDRFDIYSFDTRGSADPHRDIPPGAVVCESSAWEAANGLRFPASAARYGDLREANKALAGNCRALTGPLADHVDTASSARDLDAVRAAIGESAITYFGTGDGTLLGQQYAELFPDRLAGMALDSTMDHAQDVWSYHTSLARSLEATFAKFAQWCARTEACALHGEGVPGYLDDLRAKAEAGDLTGPDGPVSVEDLLTPVTAFTGDTTLWPLLADTLRAFGAPARAATGATAAGEPPVRGGDTATTCQDFDFDLHGYGRFAALDRKLAAVAPHTRFNTDARYYLAQCQNWPSGATNPPHRSNASPRLPRILVANSKYDVARPYEWALSLSRQLPSATLLTYDGVSVGTYFDSSCARQAIDAYLLTGRTPPKGTHCPAVGPQPATGAARALREPQAVTAGW
ncbi:alpha/beta hydrolase [Actinoplanes sp. NBRC 103695]|uniref:alpha/beta hydrolase n=1 Tax=Actinoplanes sp. NBRC 103695 TaxID=3032202 RepID=UPI0025539D10|nr:alpha/beta hydrolase [Actinoplanes sp. NBRC 103695]